MMCLLERSVNGMIDNKKQYNHKNSIQNTTTQDPFQTHDIIN